MTCVSHFIRHAPGELCGECPLDGFAPAAESPGHQSAGSDAVPTVYDFPLHLVTSIVTNLVIVAGKKNNLAAFPIAMCCVSVVTFKVIMNCEGKPVNRY